MKKILVTLLSAFMILTLTAERNFNACRSRKKILGGLLFLHRNDKKIG